MTLDNNLLGQTVKIEHKEFVWRDKTQTAYTVNDPEMLTLIKLKYGNNIRIVTEHSVSTRNYDPKRTNIFVGNTGLIELIYNG